MAANRGGAGGFDYKLGIDDIYHSAGTVIAVAITDTRASAGMNIIIGKAIHDIDACIGAARRSADTAADRGSVIRTEVVKNQIVQVNRFRRTVTAAADDRTLKGFAAVYPLQGQAGDGDRASVAARAADMSAVVIGAAAAAPRQLDVQIPMAVSGNLQRSAGLHSDTTVTIQGGVAGYLYFYLAVFYIVPFGQMMLPAANEVALRANEDAADRRDAGPYTG